LEEGKGSLFEQALIEVYGGGIEIVGYSSLPAGSGMGGSSILAATIISAVDSLLHPKPADEADRDECKLREEMLIYLVSKVEQVMTTGGL
jgi:galactokinase/mevalonate kinase-like predicted kinase